MKQVNLWESKSNIFYNFFSDIESYFKYLDDNDIDMNFVIENKFTPGEVVEDALDNAAFRGNVELTYTDETHPIAISNIGIYNSRISESFFKTHENEFKEYAKKRLQKKFADKKSYITIPDFIFDDSIIEEITSNEDLKETDFILKITAEDYTLTEDQRKKLQTKHIEFKISNRYKENEKISSKYVINDVYTISNLKKMQRLTLTIPINNDSIENLIYLNDDATIVLQMNQNMIKDELMFYKNCLQIIKNLAKHGKHYNLNFEVNNRELLRQSGLLNEIPNNITITIENDLYTYDIETYMNEEAKLDKLVAPIRDSNLSPLEKYLAVYDIVKNFKPYKENDDNREEARNYRYILDESSEYIVCVGYAKLLDELLSRVGIPSERISLSVDVSYDKGFTMDETPLDHDGHARNIVKIDDDKYHIHGYYVADSTWDNDKNLELYHNSLMTFDRKKEAKRLEHLTDEDLLLDFHDFEDFKAKIDYFMKKSISKKKNTDSFRICAYKNIYSSLIYDNKIPSEVRQEMQTYREYFNKFNITLKELEPIGKEFLAKFSKYINHPQHNNPNYMLMIEENSLKIEANNKEIVEIYTRLYEKIIDILSQLDKQKYQEFYNKYNGYFSNYNITLKDLEPIASQMITEYAGYIIPLSNKKIDTATIIKAAAEAKKVTKRMTPEELKEWLKKANKDHKDFEKTVFPYSYDPNKRIEAYVEYTASEELLTEPSKKR